VAPVPPLGKQGLLALLKQGKLPVTFGSPHPHHAVVEQDGVFRLRKLEIDQAEAEADRERSMRQSGSWMPEHYYALGKPTGPVVLEAPTLNALMQQIAGHADWPADW
jgi:hypothetical protein